MQDIVWSDRFSVGIPSMDDQHQRLIALINALNAPSHTGLAFDTIMGMLDYASIHFRAEEDLLRNAEYPELAEQQRQHTAFLDEAMAFAQMDLRAPDICARLTAYLTAWLTRHILEEDMKYSRIIPPALAR